MNQGLKCTKFIEQFLNPSPDMKKLVVKNKLISSLAYHTFAHHDSLAIYSLYSRLERVSYNSAIFPIIRSIFIYLACTVNILSIEPFNKGLLEKKKMCFGLLITPFTASQVSQTNSNSNKSTEVHSKDSSIGTRNSQISTHSIDLEINQTTEMKEKV